LFRGLAQSVREAVRKRPFADASSLYLFTRSGDGREIRWTVVSRLQALLQSSG
jgi:hypothetical protein